MFENLENRRLLAHTLTAGVLTIEGTAGPDRINIGMHGTDLVIRFNAAPAETVPAADVDAIVVNGNDGNDTITLANHSTANVTQNATLNGGAGNDVLNGGAHNDALDGGAGADDMSGGLGIDTVSYAHSPVGVKVSLDGVANDGAPATTAHPAEGDNAGADIENIQGSRFSDELIGNALNNRLSGGDGNDTLRGGAGNDTLSGGHGSDQIFGEAGNDVLLSRDGAADLVDGGDGDDRADRDALDTLVSVEHANSLP